MTRGGGARVRRGQGGSGEGGSRGRRVSKKREDCLPPHPFSELPGLPSLPAQRRGRYEDTGFSRYSGLQSLMKCHLPALLDSSEHWDQLGPR